MSTIVYYVAASLDGFIATPDGSVDWLSPFETADEDYGYSEFYSSVDSILMGSRTYKQVLGFGEWPYSGKPVWVFSRKQNLDKRPEVTVTSNEPIEVVSQLRGQKLNHTWLVGGGKLASTFRSCGLISEFIVSFIPIILGPAYPFSPHQA
jgi:dihydrofolate reductase